MSSEQHQHRENLAWHFPLSRLADKDIGVDAAEQAQQGLQNKYGGVRVTGGYNVAGV